MARKESRIADSPNSCVEKTPGSKRFLLKSPSFCENTTGF